MMHQLLDRRQLSARMMESALRQCRLSTEPTLLYSVVSILESADQIFNRFPNVQHREDQRSYISILENYMGLITPSLLYNGREVAAATEVSRQSAEGAIDHVLRYCRAVEQGIQRRTP